MSGKTKARIFVIVVIMVGIIFYVRGKRNQENQDLALYIAQNMTFNNNSFDNYSNTTLERLLQVTCTGGEWMRQGKLENDSQYAGCYHIVYFGDLLYDEHPRIAIDLVVDIDIGRVVYMEFSFDGHRLTDDQAQQLVQGMIYFYN